MRSKLMMTGCALVLAGCGTQELQMQVDSVRAENRTLTQRLARMEQEQNELRNKLAQASTVRVPTGISAVPAARRGAAGQGPCERPRRPPGRSGR